jgi:hypothetical protein
LMELVINSTTIDSDEYEIAWINNCQHWFQAYTVSYLTRACGPIVDKHSSMEDGIRSKSLDISVHQDRPNSHRAWAASAKAQHLFSPLANGCTQAPSCTAPDRSISTEAPDNSLCAVQMALSSNIPQEVHETQFHYNLGQSTDLG